MSKQQIIQDHISGHERMQKVLSQLSAEQMVIKFLGEWNVKDVIAHLTGWHIIEAKEIGQLSKGVYPETVGITNEIMHQINKENVEKRKDLPLSQIIEEWEVSFNRVISTLNLVSEQEFTNTVSVEGKEDTSIEWIFGYRYEGDEHTTAHAKQIEKYFKLS